ncbi:MAG: hypothetical protein ABIN36_08560 [Ferruginibacter sp.]
MNTYPAFPYPDLLKRLPCSVTEANGYYRVSPHKAIRLFVNMNINTEDQPGIFILGAKDQMAELRSRLKGCKEVYNFYDREVHCIFLAEKYPLFYRNIECFIEYIKKVKRNSHNYKI